MSLADCALMGPFYAHLYLDAVPGRLLRERAPLVCHWIERMNHPDPTAPGDLLAGDALPATLRPVLELVGRDAVPLLLDTVRDFERWADARAAGAAGAAARGRLPRDRLRGARFQRYTSPYTLWMVQRTLDAIRVARRGRNARASMRRSPAPAARRCSRTGRATGSASGSFKLCFEE